MRFATLALLATAMSIPAFTAATTPAAAQARAGDPVEVRIDATKPGATISRDIFGQFAEHLGTGIYGGVWVGKDSKIPNVRGIRTDVVNALRAIRTPLVRWPGGCFADEYHWRDGVGPAKNRRSSINSNWGGSVETSAFGTDEFMDFVGQVGAEVYLNVNVGSGTVKEAADWVAYMTADPTTSAGKERADNGHREPYKIKYLGLGNESWSCGGAMRPEFYADQMKLYARFVRNYHPEQGEGKPDAMLRVAVGPGDDNTAYTEEVMKTWKQHDWAWSIESLSLHRYTTGGWPPSYPSDAFDEGAYARLVKETLGMDGFIKANAAVMDKYDPEKKVSLAIDEWGVWLKPLRGTNPGFLQQQNSLRDAIIAALNINIFARHADRVKLTNIAQMINVLQAMILTDEEKMVLTPTYHVFKMYVPFQDATFIPVNFQAGTYQHGDITLPRIDAVAVKDKQGKYWLALTNVDTQRAAPVTVNVAGLNVRSARGEVLTAPKVDSINSFAAPNTVSPKPIAGSVRGGKLTIDMPAKSVAVIALEP
ncbi:alpha-N-arabinofuranosidase [Sphingobium sp. B12D2B]|uniref:alpha-N-arabinofuranosidase n=1 Tax=Sphingobium sp. B12D2B TaxID=2940577 RepID=UPI0022256E5F|nr:alpha-L-arabinofuranosidase C-terminal domain-containing protein [Sphingobium sp. B12D2B]MCW2350879.1 alpha-N-arabinofuranosidase [Sphingobium sp. B12D2B]